MYVYKYTTYGYRLEFINWWKGKKRVAQCKLIEGVPEEGGLAYKQQVHRSSHQPYTFRYSHPTDTITGIACIPVDGETQSPEAQVLEGGINYNHVTICLTPVEEGSWACDVAICTKRNSAICIKRNSATLAIEVTVRQHLGLCSVLI